MKRPYDDLPLIQKQSKSDYRPPIQPDPPAYSRAYRQQSLRRVGLLSAFKVGCLMWLLPSGLIAVFGGVIVFGATRDLRVWANYAASAALSLLIGGFFAGLGVLLFVALYNIVAYFFGGLSLTLAGEGEASTAEPGIAWDIVAVVGPILTFGAAMLLCMVLATGVMNAVSANLNSAMATANAQLSQRR